MMTIGATLKYTRLAKKEISQKDKQDFIRIQGDEFLHFLPPRADVLKKKAVQLIQFPKHKPAFQGLIPMENGWLAVIADSLGSEYTVFDIFDRDGRYIAHFKANIPSEGLFFKNGKAYALQTTEDG
jgi:ureidoglycolate hydrolase